MDLTEYRAANLPVLNCLGYQINNIRVVLRNPMTGIRIVIHPPEGIKLKTEHNGACPWQVVPVGNVSG